LFILLGLPIGPAAVDDGHDGDLLPAGWGADLDIAVIIVLFGFFGSLFRLWKLLHDDDLVFRVVWSRHLGCDVVTTVVSVSSLLLDSLQIRQLSAAQSRVQRVGSKEPFAAIVLTGGLAAGSFGWSSPAGGSVSEEVGGATGVPPQAAVKLLLRDGAAPAHRALLGAAAVRVLGAEFTDVGPVETLNVSGGTEGAAA